MPIPHFPLDLPQATLLGYNESFQPNVIESEVDAGISIRRQRYTDQTRLFSATLRLLTKEQKQILQEFYNANLAGRFEWEDPDDAETTVECRFVVGSLNFVRVTHTYWAVSFAYEIMP